MYPLLSLPALLHSLLLFPFLIGVLFVIMFTLILRFAFSFFFKLLNDFFPGVFSLLVGSFELPADVDVVRLFLFGLLALIFSWVEYILFVGKFEVGTFKVLGTCLWFTIGDSNVETCFRLDHSLDLTGHFGYHQIRIITTK
jgi:hypothetical protein